MHDDVLLARGALITLDGLMIELALWLQTLPCVTRAEVASNGDGPLPEAEQ